MAKKNNAWCSICGKPYYLCIPCDHVRDLNPWKIYTDTPEHYKIFQILHGVSSNVFTKEEAKSRLQKIDLSDLDELRENVRNTIKDIMETETKSKNVNHKKININNSDK